MFEPFQWLTCLHIWASNCFAFKRWRVYVFPLPAKNSNYFTIFTLQLLTFLRINADISIICRTLIYIKSEVHFSFLFCNPSWHFLLSVDQSAFTTLNVLMTDILQGMASSTLLQYLHTYSSTCQTHLAASSLITANHCPRRAVITESLMLSCLLRQQHILVCQPYSKKVKCLTLNLPTQPLICSTVTLWSILL
jgi:hypothetical protein